MNPNSFVGWIKEHRAVSTVPYGGYVLRTLSTLLDFRLSEGQFILSLSKDGNNGLMDYLG